MQRDAVDAPAPGVAPFIDARTNDSPRNPHACTCLQYQSKHAPPHPVSQSAHMKSPQLQKRLSADSGTPGTGQLSYRVSVSAALPCFQTKPPKQNLKTQDCDLVLRWRGACF